MNKVHSLFCFSGDNYSLSGSQEILMVLTELGVRENTCVHRTDFLLSHMSLNFIFSTAFPSPKALTMQILETLRQVQYLDHLIRMRRTGRPRELAKKLNVSERKLYRIIEELRDNGFPISYSTAKNCYVYDDTVEITICISVKGTKLLGK